MFLKLSFFKSMFNFSCCTLILYLLSPAPALFIKVLEDPILGMCIYPRTAAEAIEFGITLTYVEEQGAVSYIT